MGYYTAILDYYQCNFWLKQGKNKLIKLKYKIVLLFASDLDVYNKELVKIKRAYQSRDLKLKLLSDWAICQYTPHLFGSAELIWPYLLYNNSELKQLLVIFGHH